jgi:hypothetical protein
MREKLFAGAKVRELRERHGLTQAELARRLDLSVSYLSQIEADIRPVTIRVLLTLARDFALDFRQLSTGDIATATVDLRDTLGDPIFADDPVTPAEMKRLLSQSPGMARRLVRLHRAYRDTLDRLQTLDDAIGGQLTETMLPWDEVRDYFSDRDNYIAELDEAAEQMAETLPGFGDDPARALEDALRIDHGVAVAAGARGVMRAFSAIDKRLSLDPGLEPSTRTFLLAHQFAALAFSDILDDLSKQAPLRSEDARQLVRVGLANYAAGALLMPYRRFARLAREVRHDVERLQRRFATSFEQVCHRLSTLQRPGARGMPVFFVRVDMAGNITKRHSATRLQFARYGGTCPLWNVHEAVAAPGRILVQSVETPDGVGYVSMARGLIKRSGDFTRPDRRYAVALGCEAAHAPDFVYADALGLGSTPPTPIAASCRVCPREACTQRAFPPSDRRMRVDRDIRVVVPYGLD